MSVEQLAVVFHHSRATGTEKVVLIGIANHDGDAGSWPSIGTLAKYARVTERSVQKAIKALQLLGEIRVHTQAGGDHRTRGGYRTNRYEILLRCPDTCDRSSRHRCAGDDQVEPQARGVAHVTPHDPGGVTPASPLTGVAHVTPHQGRGVSHASPSGVSPTTPEPSLEPTSTPQPPASGGRQSSTTKCRRHTEPRPNCRGCGTTNRDQAKADRAAEAEAARLQQAALFAAERDRKAALAAQGETPATVAAKAQARAALRRGGAR